MEFLDYIFSILIDTTLEILDKEFSNKCRDELDNVNANFS